jgi:hypothetical protein
MRAVNQAAMALHLKSCSQLNQVELHDGRR